MTHAVTGLKRRLAKLERQLPLPSPVPEDKERGQWLEQTGARLQRLVEAAGELMSAEECAQVQQALGQWFEDQGGPYAPWFRDLVAGNCRLPEVGPGAMKALLLAWLSPECDGFARVCRQSGLEYPCHKSPPLTEWKVLPGKVPLQGPPPWYDLPDFFEACPGCGASLLDFDWSHLVPQCNCPWKGPRQKEGPAGA
jgi:hypothetical protein